MTFKHAYTTALEELGVPHDEAVLRVKKTQAKFPMPLELLNRELSDVEARDFIDSIKTTLRKVQEALDKFGTEAMRKQADEILAAKSQLN